MTEAIGATDDAVDIAGRADGVARPGIGEIRCATGGVTSVGALVTPAARQGGAQVGPRAESR